MCERAILCECVCVWLMGYDTDMIEGTEEKRTRLPYRCGDVLRERISDPSTAQV